MNYIKKIISIFIILSLVLSLQVNAQVTGQETAFEGDKFDAAISFLTQLKIIQNTQSGKFSAEKYMTRAELADYITRECGYEELLNVKVETSFSDVKPDYWAAASIKIAADKGIINGYGNGYFGPEDSVTFEQATKAIVCALGFDALAQAKGGFPAGYITVASEKDILKNIQGVTGTLIKKGTFAQMLYNALFVEVPINSTFGDSVSYDIVAGRTLLSENLKVLKKKATITANSLTTLYSPQSTLKDDEILANGVVYKIGSTNADKLLGREATLYYKEDKDTNDKTLVLLELDENKNEILSIVSENIDGFKDGVLTYSESKEKDNKVTDVNVSKACDYIYNGKSYPDYVKDNISSTNLFKPNAGKVDLLDNNGDGVYEVAFITEYFNYVVDAIKTNGKDVTIYDRYLQSPLFLNASDSKFKYTVINDGDKGELDEIRKGNVLSVTLDKDSSYCTINIVNEKINGIVTQMEGEDKVIILGDEYEISTSYLNAVSDSVAHKISLNDSGSFYLDIEGKIANYQPDVEKSSFAFGYLVKSARTSGITSDVQFKVYTSEGKWVILSCSDRISINDESSIKKSDLDLSTQIFSKPQLIQYAVNSNNKMYKLNTERNGISLTQESGVWLGAQVKQVVDQFGADTTKAYRVGQNTFEGEFNVNSNTIVFKVPFAQDKTGDIDTQTNQLDSFGIYDYSYFKENIRYYVDGFNLSLTKVANVVVVYPASNYPVGAGGGKSYPNRACMMFDKITQGLNKDDESVGLLHGMGVDTENTYTFKSNITVNYRNVARDLIKLDGGVSALNKGDFIEVWYDDENEAGIINIMYGKGAEPKFDNSYMSNKFHSYGGGVFSHSAESRYVLGTAYIKDKEIFLLSYAIDGNYSYTGAETFMANRTRYIVYDKVANKIWQGSNADINCYHNVLNEEEASKVLVYTVFSNVITVYIYK